MLKKFYVILSYLAFVFSPFIYGIVLIFYKYDRTMTPENWTFWFDAGVIVFLAILILVLILTKVLSLPNRFERNHLLFGLFGNVLVLLYTFQNYLNIDKVVTIYVVLLVILALHSFLISHRIQAKELWVLLIIFSVIDYSRLLITGCSFADRNHCSADYSLGLLLVMLNLMAVITIFANTVWQLIRLRIIDLWKAIHIGIVGILTVYFMFGSSPIGEYRFVQLLMILVPFFVIVDYIVSLVNKTYKTQTTVFYLRTITWFAISIFLSVYDFSSFSGNLDILIVMIISTYATLLITLIRSAKKKELKEDIEFLHLRLATQEDASIIQLQLSKTIPMVPGQLVYVAMLSNYMIGYVICEIHSFTQADLTFKVSSLLEIVMKEEYRVQYEELLVEQLETCLKRAGVSQVRGLLAHTPFSISMLHLHKYYLEMANDALHFYKTI